MQNNKNVLMIVLVLVIGVVIGYMAGGMNNKNTQVTQTEQQGAALNSGATSTSLNNTTPSTSKPKYTKGDCYTDKDGNIWCPDGKGGWTVVW